MSLAVQTQQLLQLAHSRDPGDRERLLTSIVTICEDNQAEGGVLDPAISGLVESIFMSLVVEAEKDIRQRLAERLSSAEWAPRALVNVLALDDIDVARPIIAASPVLQDTDLIRLLVEATIEHQIEVAKRPNLGPSVVDAILLREEPAVLTALACNDSAQIAERGLEQLVETSRRIAALRAPLARHPRLSSALAERLYAWVGQSLRTAIASRFEIDAAALDAALAGAVSDAHRGVQKPTAQVVWERDGERESMEQRLVDKLFDAGQLRPGYLLRALRERRMSLFEAALAKLGGFSLNEVHAAVSSPDRPELLAMACAAVQIDRSVFPTVLDLVRSINGGLPGGGAEGGRRALSAFGPFDVNVAAKAFRQALAAV